MKNKVLLILLLAPLVFFSQRRTVTDNGFEEIVYGHPEFYKYTENARYKSSYLARYTYDGNPFNDNEKALEIPLINFKISKSDVSPENIEEVGVGPYASAYTSFFNEIRIKVNFQRRFVFNGKVIHKGNPAGVECSRWEYEFIFDNDKSTYYKLDSISVKTIKSLDHELFLKFKKHKKVIVRENNITYFIKDNDSIIDYKRTHRDYTIPLSGFTAAYNKYMEVQSPSLKNKNSYRVVNGLANVNPFNLDKYIDKFILDAKTNHNIDLSYVNRRDRLILFKELNICS